MKRLKIEPRADWQKKLEALGFLYHSDAHPYWNESACYEFSADEVEKIERATGELQRLVTEAVATVIERDWFERLGISELEARLAKRAWSDGRLSIYGRFDLTFDSRGTPQLLEYNADTPTSLFEAAIVQWRWREDVMPKHDQFNSLHERLIARWSEVARADVKLYFLCMQGQLEDLTQTEYLRDAAHQAGFRTEFLFLEDLGWHHERGCFVDLENERVHQAFKLYPWEWLMRDQFASLLSMSGLDFIEPAWKRIMSSKALLPILWELFPEHPNLLPAYFERPTSGKFVAKPFLSREGAQIKVFDEGRLSLETEGAVESTDFIYQAYRELPCFDDRYAVVGSWIIGEEAAGMGLREDPTPITRNTSQFVPHFFMKDQ